VLKRVGGAYHLSHPILALKVTLISLNGEAILTLNDHSAIRELLGRFHIERADHAYTVGGGTARRMSARC
jgi:hypothetical protein